MTKFLKEKFVNDGGYISYERKFVARFKYARSGAGSFITFLIKNFEVEEYFDAIEKAAPLKVAERKGYILPHIRKWLKEAGLPINPEGYAILVKRQS